MKKISLLCAALCAVLAVATGCGDSGTSTQERDTAGAAATTETNAAPADAAKITIADMSFGEPVTVPPGAQVTIENDDPVEHSVTSQTAGQFDVHVDGNQQGTLTAPTEPGEYAFYCIYHPSMRGTLIVQ